MVWFDLARTFLMESRTKLSKNVEEPFVYVQSMHTYAFVMCVSVSVSESNDGGHL